MRGRPSVLFVHYTFPGVVGGVETVVAHHAAGLRDQANVRLLAGRGRTGVTGVERIRIPLVDSLHPAVVRVSRELARGRVTPAFAELREDLAAALLPHVRGADRVVLHNVATMGLNLPLVAALHEVAPGLPPGRLIVWIHDLAAADARHAALLHPGEPWALLSRPLPGARYVAVSVDRQEQAARLLGIAPDSIRVVPNGVDLGGMLRLSRRGRALVERLGLAAADPLLLLPARLVRRKRIELAIVAAGSLRRRGRRARLIVTGGPDPHDPDASLYLAELRALVAEAGDHDVLLFDVIGRSADDSFVADLYALSDALVFPSATEGFGLPVIEAAVNRLPIVCTDLAVFRSLAGPAATYVPVGADGEAYADAIERALATSLAAGLAGRVRRELDWRRVVTEQVVPAILG